MSKLLKIAGIVTGAYIAFDLGTIFGIGIMNDIYQGDIELDPINKLDRMMMRCIQSADALYTKVLG